MIRSLGRISAVLLKIFFGLIIGALILLLATTTGLRVGLDLASAFTNQSIRYTEASGRLLGHVELRGFVYEDLYVKVDIDHANLALMMPSLLIGRLQINELNAGEIKVAIKHAPKKEPSEPFTKLPFPLIIDTAAIARLRLQSTPESSWLDFNKVELSAAWFEDIVDIDNFATDFMMFGPIKANGRLQFLPDALRIEDTALHGPGDFKLNMLIGYDNHFEADTEWTRLQWPPSGDAMVASKKGHLRAAGAWDNYEYALTSVLRVQGVDMDAVAQGKGSLEALEVASLKAKLLAGEINAHGLVQWSPQIRIDAEGKATDLNPAVLAKEWPGKIGGQFKIATVFPNDQPLVKFDADLRNSRLRNYPFNLEAHGSWREDALQLDDALLQSGGSTLHASGRALPPFDISAQLRSPDLGQFWPGLRGRANLDGKLRGTLEAPTLSAHGQADAVGWQTYSARLIKLDAELDARGSSMLDFKTTELKTGDITSSVHLHGTGTINQHTLNLDVNSKPINFHVGVNGALNLKNRSWQGQISEGKLAPAQLGAWTLEDPAELSANLDGVTLEPACWDSGDSRACFKVVKAAQGQTGFAFRVQDFELAYFKPFMPPGWTLEGQVSGTGDLLSRSINTAHLDINTTAGRLGVSDRTVLSFKPSSIKLFGQDGSLISTVDMPLEQGAVSLNATLAPGENFGARALSGQINLDLPDLGWLRLLTREIDNATGHLQGQLQLAGTASDPAFTGSVQLDKGKLRLTTPGIELSPLNLQITGNSDGKLILNADAMSGGGTLKVLGTLDAKAEATTLHFDVKGDKFQALNIPDARVWVAPDLKIDVVGRKVDVTGDVLVPKAEITPTSFDSGVGPSRDQVIMTTQGKPTADSPWLISANVNLKLGDKVSFNGFGLKAPLTGSLTAIEEPGRFTTGRGAIDLEGGRYKAYGQDLTITTGRLIFDGGPITQPAVEIRAERKPTDEITVGVYVRGTLDAPQFSLYSTPTMPQERQLSWLVLGRSLDETASNGDRSAVSAAALSLGLSGSGLLAEKVTQRIGIDEVSVGSKPGQDTSLAMLTIGKYLSPKLFISYGVGLFQRGYSFRLQYDIGHGFKLQTETGVESGGDILYSIER
ncbi:MAG: translocation/assembly module TamB domain-containing protein [Pseudomonadota bacterium]